MKTDTVIKLYIADLSGVCILAQWVISVI